MDSCLTCRSFQNILERMENFSFDFYTYIDAPLIGLLGAVLSIWMIVTVGRAIAGSPIVWPQIITDLLLFSLFLGALTMAEFWMRATAIIANLAGDLGAHALWLAMDGKVPSSNYSGIAAVVHGIEQAVGTKLFDTAWAVMGDVSLWSPNLRELIIAAVVATVFVGLLFVFVFSILFAFVNIAAISILGPFILALGALPWTRSVFYEAMRIYLTEGMRLFVACAMAGLMAGMAASLVKTPDTMGDAAVFLANAENVSGVVGAFLVLLMFRRLVDLPNRVIKAASDTIPQFGAGGIGRQLLNRARPVPAPAPSGNR
ncbi:type IV secretion system protein [Marinibaculum pumilum]|uniref:Type IV secretion system protein n=1 Tax=Marinibaculum pumilum TaxID=1766165 RepID=A0ABV7L7N3_9PROT